MAKTFSELLFERYLRSQGLNDFEFEKSWPGIEKKPDYTLDADSSTLIFDVKEFPFKQPPAGISYANPYEPIRKKIGQVRKQFQKFKDKACTLVLYTHGFESLYDPIAINGAMYGEVGISIPFNRKTGSASGESQTVFAGCGKMIDDKSGRMQNTTVSALITLYEVDINGLRGERSFAELWPNADFANFVRLQNGRDLVPAVIVWENALARIPLTRNLFAGPCDVRWAHDGQILSRVFTGEVIKNYYPIDE